MKKITIETLHKYIASRVSEMGIVKSELDSEAYTGTLEQVRALYEDVLEHSNAYLKKNLPNYSLCERHFEEKVKWAKGYITRIGTYRCSIRFIIKAVE